MSGSFPVVPGFKSMMVSLQQKVHQSVSGLGKVQTRVLGAQLTVVSVNFPPMTREEFAPVDAFMMRQRGRDESFTLVMPDKATPLGGVSGAPVLYDDYPAGTDTIVLDAMVPSVVKAFAASDIINFGGYTKVHTVAFDADSQANNTRVLEDGTVRLLEDGSDRLMEDANTVTLTISPPLYKALNKGVSVNYNNVAYTMKFKTDSMSVDISAPRFYSRQVEMIEYIS